MVIFLVIILSVLVFVHEGGHYLVARALGVRVTEFMLGFPGPNIGFTWHGTKFGVTAVPLGGYARVCGMEPGEESPHLAGLMRVVYERGTVDMEDAARELGITDDEAFAGLEELVEWGTIEMPRKTDEYNTYRAPARDGYESGQPRTVPDQQALYESERSQQYRSLGFFKRCAILLAGPAMNLLFAIVMFVIIYSIMGFDVVDQATGAVTHMTVDPGRAIMAGFNYIGMVFMAILGLFNPQTAAETVSNSTSIVGIAVLSKSAFDAGLANFLSFSAMISVSLGLMNMLPIPPLDGGRFVIEIYQLVRRKNITMRALNALSAAGMMLFIGFFLLMLNQDIQRFVFGNWS
jgi:regulator of sigma E protease